MPLGRPMPIHARRQGAALPPRVLWAQNKIWSTSNSLLHSFTIGPFYRRRSLQANTRFSAFFEVYKIFILLHRSNLSNLAHFYDIKNRFLLHSNYFASYFAKIRYFGSKGYFERQKLTSALLRTSTPYFYSVWIPHFGPRYYKTAVCWDLRSQAGCP